MPLSKPSRDIRPPLRVHNLAPEPTTPQNSKRRRVSRSPATEASSPAVQDSACDVDDGLMMSSGLSGQGKPTTTTVSPYEADDDSHADVMDVETSGLDDSFDAASPAPSASEHGSTHSDVDEDWRRADAADEFKATPDEEGDGYGYAPAFSEEYIRRQRNIEMLKRGDVLVERETVMPHLLHLTAAERKCYEPFRAHVHLRTAQSVQLAKKKTLGVRGIRNYKIKAFAAVGVAAEGAVAEEHKPCEPLVLWRPPEEGAHPKATPVEVDNFICHWLRPHQRIGVQFLWDCVTGNRGVDGQGCILADDMGLGKTLMSITLIWMALNYGFEGPDGPKLCKRIVVCCPTSLVFNWNNEINKWLKGRTKCIAVGNTGSTVQRDIMDFACPRPSAPVLIVSYETFRNYKEYLYGEGKVDMLICDEAHRLKNDATQTSSTLAALKTRKRVLLSGTPLQNRLDEFYAMVNFCNPGVLGTPAEFRKTFERPILAGMEPDCSDKDTERAKEASSKLSSISNKFILRRTNTLLAKHLPTKLIEVVCCKPTPLQVALYNHFLKSKAVKKAILEAQLAADEGGGAASGAGGPGGGGMQVLGIIQSLSKLCNHPRLVYPGHGTSGKKEKSRFDDTFKSCAHLFPDDFDIRGDSRCFDGGVRRMSRHPKAQPASGGGGVMPELSGKMAVLDRLLCEMRKRGGERIVIVSNFTMTLDQITLLCRERFFPCVRLDGSMAVKKRRVLVEDFNDPSKEQFVFLLSSKAGGCGLNLIGANRLILFDPDWNPATDKQAAARVWRDGQKRRCFVYRFLTSGTIEEKVFQRQCSKEGLQSIVVDEKMTVNAQSSDDLRNIFSLTETESTTHDSLKCTRCEEGQCPELGGKGTEEDLATWAHHLHGDDVKDKTMLAAKQGDVNFIFSLKFPGQRFAGQQCEDDTDNEEESSEETSK